MKTRLTAICIGATLLGTPGPAMAQAGWYAG